MEKSNIVNKPKTLDHKTVDNFKIFLQDKQILDWKQNSKNVEVLDPSTNKNLEINNCNQSTTEKSLSDTDAKDDDQATVDCEIEDLITHVKKLLKSLESKQKSLKAKRSNLPPSHSNSCKSPTSSTSTTILDLDRSMPLLSPQDKKKKDCESRTENLSKRRKLESSQKLDKSSSDSDHSMPDLSPFYNILEEHNQEKNDVNPHLNPHVELIPLSNSTLSQYHIPIKIKSKNMSNQLPKQRHNQKQLRSTKVVSKEDRNIVTKTRTTSKRSNIKDKFNKIKERKHTTPLRNTRSTRNENLENFRRCTSSTKRPKKHDMSNGMDNVSSNTSFSSLEDFLT